MGTQGKQTDVVFLSGKRTGFGTFGGTLKDFTATQLGGWSSRAAIAAAGVEPAQIDHTFFGNALQTSSDAIYLARHIGLKAGLPLDTPALTLNRLCGSGFQAIVSGAMEIMLGEAEVALCGGTESMSQAPHVIRGARWGDQRLGPAGKFYEDLLWEALTDPFAGCSMAVTAENLAEKYGITREQVDEYAFRSQQLAGVACEQKRFDAEITPITLKSRKGETQFACDEHMRPETTMESLGKLKPYFKEGGTVTAGNASGIGDGGAAVMIASAAYAQRNGLQPIGRLVSWGIAGVEPTHMGIGPAPASLKLLGRLGLSIADVDVIELNEAFAAQGLAVLRQLGLPDDAAQVNPNGGAIALGHPLGMSGARLALTATEELQRGGGRYALTTMCIGVGQGIALALERV